ncbi:type II toxin-antitoxin system Phd/YefM family antitoxin [Pseudomonas chlororaphis]|uniref:type II toxin-antitoxin system Phd/YefM family antitoxin n=1 Tax=Pseudomonas chlororaphis TaxID=587753 RepID=UPI001EE46500|nr:type II toxin-antitoxin system Phd/YefM family antitoxin [Pseudomonas chlororaphis]
MAGFEYSGYICPEYWRSVMITVPLAEAKNNLSKLVDDAAAGQVITIAKHGRALARLVPVGKPSGQRIGAMKGKLVLPDDFDTPLPDDMLDAFEGSRE